MKQSTHHSGSRQENDGGRPHDHRGPHVDTSRIPRCLHAADASSVCGGGADVRRSATSPSALPAACRCAAVLLHSHEPRRAGAPFRCYTGSRRPAEERRVPRYVCAYVARKAKAGSLVFLLLFFSPFAESGNQLLRSSTVHFGDYRVLYLYDDRFRPVVTTRGTRNRKIRDISRAVLTFFFLFAHLALTHFIPVYPWGRRGTRSEGGKQ